MPGLSGSFSALCIMPSRVRRRPDHCTGPYRAVCAPGSNSGIKSRCIRFLSTGRTPAGNRQPMSSGAMWPACCSRPPPGPSSSTQPGFTSRLSPPRTSVKLPPDTRMIRQISSSSASSYWPVWNRSAVAVTRPLHFSRSAFIRTPHSTVSFPQCTMPAACGQPINLSTSKEASCL